MMLTFYDYLPSQNGWKVRQVLAELAIPHETKLVSIFEGEGQSPNYLEINPWGAVPAISFPDGRTLAESNALLWYLAQGSHLCPVEPFTQAKVLQWMSFEADYVQPTIGSLRYWTLTGKLSRRDGALVAAKRAGAAKALAVLDRQLAGRPFIAGPRSIADISLFAYAAHARDANIPLDPYPNFQAWSARMADSDPALVEHHLYSADVHSTLELP